MLMMPLPPRPKVELLAIASAPAVPVLEVMDAALFIKLPPLTLNVVAPVRFKMTLASTEVLAPVVVLLVLAAVRLSVALTAAEGAISTVCPEVGFSNIVPVVPALIVALEPLGAVINTKGLGRSVVSVGSCPIT